MQQARCRRTKEEHIMEQTAQYDHIGSKYDEYAQTATLKRAEQYTFFRLVGLLEGKHVLDLASGLGFYTRQLKQRGAAQTEVAPEDVARYGDAYWREFHNKGFI